MVLVLSFLWSWCFQVCWDEVHKDQVPDLPYLSASACASYEIFHHPTPSPPIGVLGAFKCQCTVDLVLQAGLYAPRPDILESTRTPDRFGRPRTARLFFFLFDSSVYSSFSSSDSVSESPSKKSSSLASGLYAPRPNTLESTSPPKYSPRFGIVWCEHQ